MVKGMALVAGRGVQATTRRTVRRCHIHAKVGLGPHVDNPHSTRGAAVCVRCGSYQPRRGSCDRKCTQVDGKGSAGDFVEIYSSESF